MNMLQLAAAALLLLLSLAEGGSVWPQPLTVVRFLEAVDKEGSVIQSQLNLSFCYRQQGRSYFILM